MPQTYKPYDPNQEITQPLELPGVGMKQTRTGVAGFNPSSALSPSNTLNELAAQMDPRLAQIREKNQLRHMTPLQQAQRTDRIVLENAASMGDPAQRNRISLQNNVGPALDQNYVTNRPYLAPESKAVIGAARKQFNRELTDLLSGTNKSRWTTMQDYEDAVNALPSVQQYGSLIEDHATSVARRLVSPSMQAQFTANDENAQSFIRWAKSRPDLAYLSSLGDAALAQQYHDNPQLRQMFDQDPNAAKYDATPDGKVTQRAVTMGQEQSFKEAAISKDIEAMNAAARKAVEDNPNLELVPSEADPRQLRAVKKAATPEEDAMTQATSKKMRLDAEKKLGISVDEKLSRQELADLYTQQQYPVIQSGDKIILPGEPGYDISVQATHLDGTPIRNDNDLKAAEMTGNVKYSPKPGVQTYQPSTTQGASSDVQAAMDWLKANPKHPQAAAVRKKLQEDITARLNELGANP